MAECFFSLICLIKLVMNKDMIFDADGQAAQTELKEMLAKRVSLFCVDFCSGCFKSALRNQNNYSIMDEEFNRINCSAVIRCRTTQRSG